MANGWIGVDLDGTLAFYDGWKDKHIGDPIPDMAFRVRKWLGEGKLVKIMTARVGPPTTSIVTGVQYTDADIEEQRTLIQDWTELHFGVRLEVTASKDFAMIQLWDDRAIQIIENTGKRADGKF